MSLLSVLFVRFTHLRFYQVRTDEEQEKVEKRLLQRQEEKKRKLKAAGIEYDFDAVAYVGVSLKFLFMPDFLPRDRKRQNLPSKANVKLNTSQGSFIFKVEQQY